MRLRSLISRLLALRSLLAWVLAVQGLVICHAKSAPDEALSAGWRDTNTVETRLRAAIAHQNSLRAQASSRISQVRGQTTALPQLELLVRKDDYAAAFRTNETGPTRFWIGHGFPEMGTTGIFTIDGERLIKSDYNDFWSLNYVYSFDGATLSATQSLGEWQIGAMEGREITLYRQVGEKELAAWKTGKIDGLGSARWGFGEADGKILPALHFATRPWNDEYDVKITLSKENLLELARRRPFALWCGALDNEGSAVNFRGLKTFEIVLTTEAIAKLHADGAVKVEFKTKP